MDHVVVDIKVYAEYVTERLEQLKKSNAQSFTRNEIDIVNDAIDLIKANKDHLEAVR